MSKLFDEIDKIGDGDCTHESEDFSCIDFGPECNACIARHAYNDAHEILRQAKRQIDDNNKEE
jgi:hypothetical protein